MRYPLPPFADLLAEHMQRAKIGQRQLAALLGYRPHHIRSMVKPMFPQYPSPMPMEQTIHRMADHLGLTADQRDEMLASAGYLPSDDGILALAYHIECARFQFGDEDTCPRYRRAPITLDREEALPF